MGIPSDRRFLAVARKQLGHLFPVAAHAAGLLQASPPARRHARVADRRRSPARVPGSHDDLLLVDSHPGASAPAAAKRSGAPRSPTPPTTATAPATAATSGASGCTRSSPPTARPRALALTSPKTDERDVALSCSHAASAWAARSLVGDKGYAGREFATRRHRRWTPRSSAPPRATSPADGPHLAPIRQRIESDLLDLKDLLTLERHGARTLARPPRTRRCNACSASPPAIALNHQLGRPSRALVDYTRLTARNQPSSLTPCQPPSRARRDPRVLARALPGPARHPRLGPRLRRQRPAPRRPRVGRARGDALADHPGGREDRPLRLRGDGPVPRRRRPACSCRSPTRSSSGATPASGWRSWARTSPSPRSSAAARPSRWASSSPSATAPSTSRRSRRSASPSPTRAPTSPPSEPPRSTTRPRTSGSSTARRRGRRTAASRRSTSSSRPSTARSARAARPPSSSRPTPPG